MRGNMSLYKTQQEKLADIITANANPLIIARCTSSDGEIALKVLGKPDLRTAKENQAAAISRLAIDRAMVAVKGE